MEHPHHESFLIKAQQPAQPSPHPHHDERSFVLLKRKLATLKYTDHLDISSCALVDRLVDDLVRTTESYQSLKVQEHQKQLESSAFQSKVVVVTSSICCRLRLIGVHSASALSCCRQKL